MIHTFELETEGEAFEEAEAMMHEHCERCGRRVIHYRSESSPGADV